MTGKTTLGLDENVEGLLCYLLGWMSGLLFLLIEKNTFVRFHAVQSLIIFLLLFAISMVTSLIPYIGVPISMLMAPLALVLWIVLMYKAFKGEMFKLPIIGDVAEQQMRKSV